jgi:hypothetical protein
MKKNPSESEGALYPFKEKIFNFKINNHFKKNRSKITGGKDKKSFLINFYVKF